MTNYELAEKLGEFIRQERKITNEILHLINVALERRSYLELGYSSMFDWLVKGFGYSNAAAYRRIEAARLLKAVPEASRKLEDGQVNLTTLSKAQSVIKNQEKATVKKISSEFKAEVIGKIENKSTDHAERVLFSLFPEAAAQEKKEHRRVVDADTTRVSVNFSNDTLSDMARAKEILSHKFPNGSDGEILAYALKFLIKHMEKENLASHNKIEQTAQAKRETKTEPMTQTASAAEAIRVNDHETQGTIAQPGWISKVGARRITFKKYHGQCCFKDPRSGKICGIRYQVQVDHIIPRALGGSDDPSNLRLLCRQHNLMMAERILGKSCIEKYRTQR
jgi:hypothetical protein